MGINLDIDQFPTHTPSCERRWRGLAVILDRLHCVAESLVLP